MCRKSSVKGMDSKMILATSRELISAHKSLAKEGQIILSQKEWPEIIKTMNPSSVIVRADHVSIILNMGLGACHVLAFDYGCKGYGKEKIIEGLWFSTNSRSEEREQSK